MKQYEVTFIVDPVLSGDEIKATVKTYEDLLAKEKCTIVHMDEMGLRQLAYNIEKRNTGVYYSIEFQVETGEMINVMELAMRRDDRILRFLTVALQKYGIKYNEDKRNGLIGKVKKKVKKKDDDNRGRGRNSNRDRKSAPKKTSAPAPKKTATPAPKKEATPTPTKAAAPAPAKTPAAKAAPVAAPVAVAEEE